MHSVFHLSTTTSPLPSCLLADFRHALSSITSVFLLHRIVAVATAALVLRPEFVLESPEGLVKTHTAASHPRISHPAGLVWEPGICISNKFPADAASLGTTF